MSINNPFRNSLRTKNLWSFINLSGKYIFNENLFGAFDIFSIYGNVLKLLLAKHNQSPEILLAKWVISAGACSSTAFTRFLDAENY